MGTAERKIREKEKRKKEILKCAERLFSSKKGMESTMDDLAQKTELGKGTLYLYFPNKESILLALAENGIGVLRKRLMRILDDAKSGVQQLSDTGDTFVKFLHEKPFYAELILRFEKSIVIDDQTGQKKYIIEPLFKILESILERGKSDGTMRRDVGTKELVAVLWSQMLGVLNTLSGRKEILGLYGVDTEWMIRGHFRVIMHGLAEKV